MGKNIIHPQQNSEAPPQKTITTGLLMLMAITTGIAVASNYYAQPLLRTLSNYFSVTETLTATLVTAAQLSYALGLVFITPLGDILERKRLIVTLMLFSTAGLIISALSQHYFVLLLTGTAITGLFAVVAQVLIPYASTLVSANERGRVVGTLMGGLLLGILLARTFAGTVSSLGHWRWVYILAAGLMLITTILLAIYLPSSKPQTKIRYPQLIASIFSLFGQYHVLRLRSILGFLTFASFTVLWTPLAYLLSDRYCFSDFVIGLFGLIGALGVLVAPIAGSISDKGKGAQGTTIGLTIMLASWVTIYFSPDSLIALIIGILFLDLAIQLVHIINMSEVYKLDPNARSRLNAGYIFSYFLGGTLGSVTSAYAYDHYKWLGVSICGLSISALALLIWIFSRKQHAPSE